MPETAFAARPPAGLRNVDPPSAATARHEALEARAAERDSGVAALLQGRRTGPRPVQSAPAPNRTGLPDALRTGVERLSGLSMADVRVHYGSARPALLQAHAYAQGSDIHLAPGQERHLPHEAWHVVQQKQGRVRPTRQAKGIDVNDHPALEREADRMGAHCLHVGELTAGGMADPFPGAAAGSVPGAVAQLTKIEDLQTAYASWQHATAAHTEDKIVGPLMERIDRTDASWAETAATALRKWAATHDNAVLASILETKTSFDQSSFGAGQIRSTMSTGSEFIADVYTQSANVNMVTEAKESSVAEDPGSIDALVQKAVSQLDIRIDSPLGGKINHWRVAIGSNNPDNPWPLTATQAAKSPTPTKIELGNFANGRTLTKDRTGTASILVVVDSQRWGSFQFFLGQKM